MNLRTEHQYVHKYKNLLEQYTEILKGIYGNHLKVVILYGSYARGDYRADSDIDIMILAGFVGYGY